MDHFNSCIAGATLYKCLNRISATFIAGSIAVGVHFAAKQSGEIYEHIIMGLSMFIFGNL